jgi:tRNA-2-methylthio-N6-dimethylallyladenosine synthase
LGQTVEVLFEEEVRGRWKGRTSTNKLVFAESDRSLHGQVLPVQITWTGPWSMQGRFAPSRESLFALDAISVTV